MNKKIMIGVILAFLLIATIGFTYAFFTATITGNDEAQDQIVETGTLSLVYKDGQELTLNKAFPGDSVEKVFTVTNTGTLDTEYSINFVNLINTITNEELVVSYTCTSYTGYVDVNNKGTVSGVCEGITNKPIEESATSTSSLITNNILIASNITHEYTITITFIEANTAQDYNQGKTFSALININEVQEIVSTFSVLTRDNEIFYDNEASTYVTSNTGINFDAISSNTNGKGLYRTSDLTKTEDIDGDGEGEEVLYFRGAVTNNYVVFAGYCWRIVRTNEDGSVKLRYGGTATASGDTYTCPQTGTNVGINSNATYKFNPSTNATKYVGYTYDTNTSSIAKSTIDAWYSTNIASKGEEVTSLIADAPYCNDRSVASTSGNYIYYGAYGRLITNRTPQYKCPQASDKYTVSSDIGNGLLTYPIALLTADEVSYAGGRNSTNNTYYLYTSAGYWSMSPFWRSSNNNVQAYGVISTGGLGSLGSYNYDYALLPALSLTSEAEVIQGTGLYNDPYVIG